MPSNCSQNSVLCRLKALEARQQVDQHPPATVSYGGNAFSWDSASQSGNIPIFQTWTFEALSPEQELEASTDRIYLHHAPTGMLVAEGIRINSAVPGSAGLSVQVFTGGVAIFPSPVQLTGGTVFIPAASLVANQRSILAGEFLEVQVVTEPPGYGTWYGLSVDFVGYVDLQALSAGAAPFNLLAPSISGFTTSGSLLQSVVGSWTNNPTSYTYQWYRSGEAIAGATQPTYVLGSADEGLAIQLRVTATNIYGSASTLSNILAVDNPSAIPQNLTLPVISGSTVVGGNLSVSLGTWSGSPTTYSYQWKVGGVPVSGATSGSYVIQPGDVGSTITVGVIASNINGSSAQAVANGVSASGGATSTLYWGRSSADVLSGSGVLALSNNVAAATPVGSFNFTSGTSSYYYFAVPESMTAPAVIKLISSNTTLALAVSPDFPDYSLSVNGLSYMMVSVNGVNYRVFRSYNTIGAADGINVTI